ncbi:MAG TPA: ATP-binding protein [Candidatus Ornithospirochaeta stercorigallinarum]|nr:ATP-binding protein [Candidatus Ornithospirochaeta stercorigallinarum]
MPCPGPALRQKGTVIFASNKKPSEWKSLFPDVELAKCVLDRIMDRCIEIEMTQI